MSVQPRPNSSRGTTPESLAIVFPGYFRQWAEWIYHVLDGRGLEVFLHRWDPPREEPLQTGLADLLRGSHRVLLVLNEWFFELGPRAEGEWDEALRGFVAEHRERFAAVHLTGRPLPNASTVLRPADLYGVGEDEAVHRLLTRLDLPPQEPAGSPQRRAGGLRFPGDPPPVWAPAVPRRNHRFTGRDELLNSLQQRLADAAGSSAVCALVGTPGVGKTDLATEFVYRFRPQYDVVWWVPADSRGTLRERYGELAPHLGIVHEGGGTGGRIRAVREALRRGDPYRRWLVVFDGWDDLDGAADVLPQGDGHVLITARNRLWSDLVDLVEVPEFSRAESTGYLMRRAAHLSAPEADEVSAELEDLPLALDQAAAYLGELDLPAAEYLARVRERPFGELPQLDTPAGYPASSLTSWSILINGLSREQPRTVEILTLCSAFAPGRIPLGLVRELPARDLPEELRWLSRHDAAWSHALDVLANFSVLRREEATNGPTAEQGRGDVVHMHRVVHSIIARLTAGEDQESYRRVVRRALAEADPGDAVDSRSWRRYAEIHAHLGPSGALDSTNGRVRHTLINCLRYCVRSGEYVSGARLAERVREHWTGVVPAGDPLWMLLTSQQGAILRKSGDFGRAYELDQALLADLQSAAPEDVYSLNFARSALASDYRSLGRYDEALELQRVCEDTAEELLGPDDFNTLVARHNVAVSLRLLGRYQEASEVDTEVLRRREEALTERSPATLDSGNYCALDLRMLGEFRLAAARQEQMMRLHAQVLGEEHPQTLWAGHHLAMCRYRAGLERTETDGQLASFLQRLRRMHGARHYSALRVANDYGNYQRENGDLGLARELVTEADDGLRAVLGPAHPIVTGMRSNVGLLLQAEGDREGAAGAFDDAYEGLRVLLGQDHPWTLGCALNASGGRNIVGDVKVAAELSGATLERARQTLGEEHPLTLLAQIASAADLRALRSREAGKLEQGALQGLIRTLGAQHPHTVASRQRIRPYWDFEVDM